MKKQEQYMTKTPVVWMGALICCMLWGSAFPCVKIGYGLMNISAEDTATQILYAGCRFTLAGILTIVIGSVMQRRLLIPKKNQLGKITWLSLLQTVLQYLFFYVGLAHTSGVKASIIEGVNVFVAMLVAGYLFKQEQVTLRKMAGCCIGFLGVILVNLAGGTIEAGFHLTGEGFIFLSTFAYAFSSVYMKRYAKDNDPVLLSGYQFLLGGIIMVVCGAAVGGRLTVFSRAAAGMLVYLSLVSAVAYSIWGILLKYNPVSRVAVFGFMNPVCGVMLSAVLLKEGNSLGINGIIALILVCVGIYMVNWGQNKTND
ncbi:MAG: DMT family transporter [bacterium]|nr:DMT family transporter [bacterium]